MHKKWVFCLVGFGLLSLSCQAWASDVAILPPNDKLGCASFMQQGEIDPPNPTLDVTTLQICMDSCDSMYQSLGDQGRVTDMFKGISYCRQTLNNLYYASVTQNIYDQLNEKTLQENATKKDSLMNQLHQLSKQNAEKNSNNQNAAPSEPANSTSSSGAASTAAPKGPPDEVNWF